MWGEEKNPFPFPEPYRIQGFFIAYNFYFSFRKWFWYKHTFQVGDDFRRYFNNWLVHVYECFSILQLLSSSILPLRPPIQFIVHKFERFRHHNKLQGFRIIWLWFPSLMSGKKSRTVHSKRRGQFSPSYLLL